MHIRPSVYALDILEPHRKRYRSFAHIDCVKQIRWRNRINPEFWLLQTDHPVPADARSGLHLSCVAPSRAAVDAFHAAGLAGRGKGNGKPGPRPDYGPTYCAACAIDPDGYRIEAHCGTA